MLGGLTIHPPVANFLQCLSVCGKNYENWLAADKVIAKIIRLTFLAHPVETSIFDALSADLKIFFFLAYSQGNLQ